jgi:hypothetical protein
MTRCSCCGARLLDGEYGLCSRNECFLHWLVQCDPTLRPTQAEIDHQLRTFTCPDWKCTHNTTSPESSQ